MPSWRNDVASDLSAYRAGGGALTQFEGLDPARAAKAAEGCAAIEPECDLIEEVLRLGGLDAVPPVSLPALAAASTINRPRASDRLIRVAKSICPAANRATNSP